MITTLNTTINNRTTTSTVMKGNQGLEALANLCNNASKTEDAISNERDTQQSQRSAAIAGPTQEFNSAMNNYTSNAAQQPHQNQPINGLPQNLAAIIKSMGPQMNQQQATNVMANAGLGVNNDTMSALHQLAYLNPLGSTASSVLQLMNQANTTTQNNFPYTGMDATPLSSLFGASQAQGTGGNFQVLPTATSSSQNMSENSAMQPPQFQPPRTATTSAQAPAASHQPILMRNVTESANSTTSTDESLRSLNAGETAQTAANPQDKKLQKRAANRRSAQLSRKRKKQFIEELKEENDDLRRKEQILRSIPDLIVVFDSSGKLGFVSHSVSNFLAFTPRELVGTSFWERLCEGSVRLLKAAFMDALAARTKDHETTPLGSGVWELRLQDKDGDFVLVTLNGVVHFSGEAPECVCSIRPMKSGSVTDSVDSAKSTNAVVTEGLAATNKIDKKSEASELVFRKIRPEQRVVKTNPHPTQRNVRPKVVAGPDGRPAPISDVDSGTSVVSSE